MNAKQMVVDDLLTNYQQSGEGPIILMLHGWGDTSETFSQLVTRLDSNYTLITLDLPGFGKTHAPGAVWNLDNYAEFASEFLKKLNISSLFAIIGHSNGGALAIKGVATNQLTAEKLILLASAGIRDQQKVRRYVLKIIAKVGKAFTFFLPIQTRQRLRKKLYGVAGSDLLVAPHIQETFKKTVRQDVQSDASKIEIPTLLIYGDADSATPILYGTIYRRLIKNSRLEIIKGAGHFVHQEQPDKISHLIQEFLA